MSEVIVQERPWHRLMTVLGNGVGGLIIFGTILGMVENSKAPFEVMWIGICVFFGWWVFAWCFRRVALYVAHGHAHLNNP